VNRRILLSWFVIHFAALLFVSVHETARLISLRLTNIPPRIADSVRRGTSVTETQLGLPRSKINLLRQALIPYLACGGMDAGYGYFAPNVPNSYQLSFELHGTDDRIELRSLQLASSDLGLRVASLVDQIGGTSAPELREHMLKKIAMVVARRNSVVRNVHVSLSQITSPTLGEYARGQRQTAVLLYQYNFSVSRQSSPAK
jgi:hypothetical protein